MTTAWRMVLVMVRTPLAVLGMLLLPLYTALVSCWVLIQFLRLFGSFPIRMVLTVIRNDNAVLTTDFAHEFFALMDNFGLLWVQLWDEEKSLVRWWLTMPPDRSAQESTKIN